MVHSSPPEVAIDVDDARLYVTDAPPEGDVPALAGRLGATPREVIVDIHNPPVAEGFLAQVLDGLDAVVDDDHGHVMESAQYVARVRERGGGREAPRA